MPSLLTPYDPPVILIVLGFVITIGIVLLLSYTRRGEVRAMIFGKRRLRPPMPPVIALDPAMPVLESVMRQRATRGQRLETFLLDVVVIVICIALTLVATLAAVTLSRHGQPQDAAGLLKYLNHHAENEASSSGLLEMVMFADLFLLIPLYYIVFEARYGRTIGKFVVGTRVVDLQGCPITTGQAIGRTLCRLLKAEPISLLFLNDRYGGRSAWHDAIVSTAVVATRRK